MQWIGYVDPMASELATLEPYVAYTMNDARLSGARYAMVNLAETDCPGCQHSATELESGVTVTLAGGGTATWTGASVVQAGGLVIEVLETTGFTTLGTQADLQAWIGKYALPVTSVRDPDCAACPAGGGTIPTCCPTVTLNTLGHRDQAYIVDLSTMTILAVEPGSEAAVATNSAGQAIQKMAMLLGQ
jgi:hypothetical protein